MLRWYCAYTSPQLEDFARGNLAALGFEVFLPRLVKQQIEAPPKLELLFPRYLFVQFDVRDVWQDIARTRGVQRLLGNEYPAPIPKGVVEGIRDRADVDGLIQVPLAIGKRVAPGQLIRITSGSFIGFEGICVASAKRRVQILLTLFGRSQEISLEASIVEPVELG